MHDASLYVVRDMSHKIIPLNESGTICAEVNLCRDAIDECFDDPTRSLTSSGAVDRGLSATRPCPWHHIHHIGGCPGAEFIRTACCGIHPHGGYRRPGNARELETIGRKILSGCRVGNRSALILNLTRVPHVQTGQVSLGQLCVHNMVRLGRSLSDPFVLLYKLYPVGSVTRNT